MTAEHKETPVYYAQKKMYEIAKSIKKDALIIGVSPHPFFSETQDIIRTYDILTFDPTNLVELIPSLGLREKRAFVKAGCGKTARPVCAADGGQPYGRLLRPDTREALEQKCANMCGESGGKWVGPEQFVSTKQVPDAGPGKSAKCVGTDTSSRKQG